MKFKNDISAEYGLTDGEFSHYGIKMKTVKTGQESSWFKIRKLVSQADKVCQLSFHYWLR